MGVGRRWEQESRDEEACEQEWSDESAGYDWSEFSHGSQSFPPAKLYVTSTGAIGILDGNHRLTWWEEQGYQYAGCWILQEPPAPRAGGKRGAR